MCSNAIVLPGDIRDVLPMSVQVFKMFRAFPHSYQAG